MRALLAFREAHEFSVWFKPMVLYDGFYAIWWHHYVNAPMLYRLFDLDPFRGDIVVTACMHIFNQIHALLVRVHLVEFEC